MGGYSFGACIAVEIALQLPSTAQILLLDGSHSYVATHTKQYRTKFSEQKHAEAAVVSFSFYLILQLIVAVFLALCFSTTIYTKFRSKEGKIKFYKIILLFYFIF